MRMANTFRESSPWLLHILSFKAIKYFILKKLKKITLEIKINIIKYLKDEFSFKKQIKIDIFVNFNRKIVWKAKINEKCLKMNSKQKRILENHLKLYLIDYVDH